MPTIEKSYPRSGAAGGGFLSSGDALGSLGSFAAAGVPTTQFNAIAAKGALCIDYTNGKLYINTGSLATSTWTVVGTQV